MFRNMYKKNWQNFWVETRFEGNFVYVNICGEYNTGSKDVIVEFQKWKKIHLQNWNEEVRKKMYHRLNTVKKIIYWNRGKTIQIPFIILKYFLFVLDF